MYRIVTTILFVAFCVVARANADTLLNVSFTQGASGDTATPGLPFVAVCSNSTTASTLSLGCSGSLTLTPVGPQVGRFEGSGQATASTTDQLSLGSAVSLDVVRNNPTGSGLFPMYVAVAESSAIVTDSILVLGAGTGEGFLQLVFNLTGSITELADPFSLDGFNPTMTGDFGFADGSAAISVNGSQAIFQGGVYTVSVPVSFGLTQLLTIDLTTRASASVLQSEGYRIIADFLNTAVLTGAVVLDAGLNLLGEATLVSSSGYTYGGLTSSPQPIPEPATIGLVGLGAVAAFRARKRLARR